MTFPVGPDLGVDKINTIPAEVENPAEGSNLPVTDPSVPAAYVGSGLDATDENAVQAAQTPQPVNQAPAQDTDPGVTG